MRFFIILGGYDMKRLISLILSMLILTLTASISASALTSGTGVGLIEGISKIDYDPTTYIEPVKNQNDTYSYKADEFYASANYDMPYMFYSFLNSNQKAVYNTIKANPVSSQYQVELPVPIVCESSSLSLTQEAYDEVVAACIGGMSAVCDDYPMIYWIDKFNMQFYYSYTISGGIYTITLSDIVIFPEFNADAYSDLDAVQAAYDDMEAVVNSITIKGNTRYEQVKYIHDFIADRVVYDPDLNTANKNPTDHYPTSVFLEPYITVCEGYAEAFKILCDKAGIPCIVVVGQANGGGHAWNYVKMEDNKWYAVDLTWDDQGVIFYDYFLTGGNSTNYYFDGDSTTFLDSHAATGQRFVFESFALTYPVLSPTAYSRMMLNVNSTATVSKSKKMLYIMPGSTAEQQVQTPYGYTTAATGSKTGSSLTVKNDRNVQVETYTVIMRGDMVADAVVDAADYTAVKMTAVGDPSYAAAGTPQYEAGDLNADGVVDAFDTALLDLQMNGG